MEKLQDIGKKIFEMYNEIGKVLNQGIDQNEANILYHYTNVLALKSILENETLWFSNGKFMNDSTDLSYAIE